MRRFPVSPPFFIALLVLIAFAIISLAPSDRLQPNAGAFTLAVAGPMSGDDQRRGEEMVRSAQLYLDEINAKGGVQGKRVELLVFDDQNNPEVARQKAEEIVGQEQIAAVLGHYSSSTSQAAGEIYGDAGLPALTGSATADGLTRENRWYFRTIFNNHDQGAFLANYMKRIMGYTVAEIVYDTDAYGSSLATTFEEFFVGLGGRVTRRWQFDSKDEKLDEQLAEIIHTFTTARRRSSDMVFLATHAQEAAKLVVELRRNGVMNRILGGDALAGAEFVQQFQPYVEEQTVPGYFSTGIYATSPILFDLAGEQTQQFRATFTQKYGVEPTWVAATYYDAARMAVLAIERAAASSDERTATRSAIRKQLIAINSPAEAIPGVTGNLYFDQYGNVQQTPMIGVFDKGAFISAAVQLQNVTELAQVADLEQALANGHILLIDGKYMYQTDVVYTGIDLNEIGNLATDGGSYTIDFYIWFRARTGVDAANVEFLNYAVERLESGQRIQLGEPLATKSADGTTYQAFRLKADFASDFDFGHYPFDQQRLAIQFRHLTATRDRLIYVVDEAGLGETTSPGILNKLARSQALASLSDWYPVSASYFQNTLYNQSSLGNPQLLGQEANIQYSRFNLVIELRRNIFNFITRNLLPVFFIISLSYVSFFLPTIDFEALIPILTGTVLSIVFFHLDVSNDLDVSYTVALDYVFYVLYAMFVIQLLLGVIAWHTQGEGMKKSILFVVKLSYPAVILLTAVTLLYIYPDSWRIDWGALWHTNPAPEQPGADTDPQPIGNDTAITPGTVTSTVTETIPSTVTLRLGSWRSEDEAAMQRILAVFQQQHPEIVVQWETGAPATYSDMLIRQLQQGIAPDLFYITSFSGGEKLLEEGYVATLEELPELKRYFTAVELAPWSTGDGRPYGVPLIAVAFGVYYNIDLFAQLEIQPPTTWEQLLQAAQTIQKAGYVPFANGAQEAWAVNETIFMSLAPNLIGGREGRLQYLSGERCFNDDSTVAAFQAVADLAPFLPANKAELSFADTQQLFLDGKAAMLLGASTDIPTLEAAEPKFQWSVFAVPAPQGQPTTVTFQPYAAVGLNAASAHPEQARLFLSWLATPTVGELLSNELPGLFVPHGKIPAAQNPHVQAFLTLIASGNTDVGWAWPQISAKPPDGYSLMMQGAVAVILGEKTAQVAADELQSGLAQWFQPAQRCLLAR
jgi:branched-chain amino acid transport system substrate-binding protein